MRLMAGSGVRGCSAIRPRCDGRHPLTRCRLLNVPYGFSGHGMLLVAVARQSCAAAKTKAAGRQRPQMAGSVSTRRRQEADRRPADTLQLPDAVGPPHWTGPPDGRASSVGRRVLRSDQISVCSEISKASSTSMPRYLTVDSSLRWPSSSCTARRFFVRR